jgi:uncharacterized RDD family membrane protein YckC
MSQTITPNLPAIPHTVIPATRGVMISRMLAWLVDALLLVVITGAIWLILLPTLGLSLFLMPVVAVGTFMAYAAVTISGSKQATIGMRMAGLKVTDTGGNRPEALAAAVHALLFYVAAPVFPVWLLMIATGFVRSDRRFGHDLITGLCIGRRTD